MVGNAPVLSYIGWLFGHIAGKEVAGFYKIIVQIFGQIIAFERAIFF